MTTRQDSQRGITAVVAAAAPQHEQVRAALQAFTLGLELEELR
ncbi:MAG TPA: hypothetical protein VEA40_03375 [Ramlibacter sp.]|nr:hypothetical protein [Ramlibacter sp.]